MSRQPALAKVDNGNPTPKYLQAREILREAIRSGHFEPGSKLPSTAEIGVLCDISLITAHKALEGLVESGWVRREVGRGTYVREDLEFAYADRETLSVGLILEEHVNLDDYYHQTLISGLRQAARDAQRHVEFFFHERYDVQERAGKTSCAICVHPPLGVRGLVEKLALQIPTVVLGGSFNETTVAYVDCDNDAGTRKAVRHLLKLGHTRVLVLSAPDTLSNSRDRATAAIDELNNHGLQLATEDRLVSRDTVVLDEHTRVQLHDRLQAANRPTAIVAGGYYLALAAMQVIRRLNLRIPEDISIVGFDDPPSAPLLSPPLTTVQQPLVQMAEAAFRLINRTDGQLPQNADSLTLATKLVVRESTASAAAPNVEESGK